MQSSAGARAGVGTSPQGRRGAGDLGPSSASKSAGVSHSSGAGVTASAGYGEDGCSGRRGIARSPGGEGSARIRAGCDRMGREKMRGTGLDTIDMRSWLKTPKHGLVEFSN